MHDQGALANACMIRPQKRHQNRAKIEWGRLRNGSDTAGGTTKGPLRQQPQVYLVVIANYRWSHA